MIRSAVFLLALALAPSAFAQTTAPITGEVLTIYRQGQATPAVAPQLLSRARITRNQPMPPLPGATVANPTQVAWADPQNQSTIAAIYNDPSDVPGVLNMLAADGSTVYEATLRFRTAAGDGPEGPRSNLFTRQGLLPVAPALRITAP